MNRCRYCGKEIRGTSDFCGQSCETRYQKAVEKDRRKIPYFIVGMGVGFLVLLCGVLLQIDWVLGAGIAFMGLVTFILPFTTPETTALLGYPKAKILGRVLGVLLIGVGIWLAR